jgi:hypothetical protein
VVPVDEPPTKKEGRAMSITYVRNNEEIEEIGASNRFGSIRKKSSVGVVNHAFAHDDEKVLHETIEIVKDLPALHLEHCKL